MTLQPTKHENNETKYPPQRKKLGFRMKRMLNRIFRWFFKRSAWPYWCILALDCVVFMLSGLMVYYLFHNGMQTLTHFWSLVHILLIYLVVSVAFYKTFHTYAGIIRYSSFVDLSRVAAANLSAMVVVLLLHYWVYRWPERAFAHLTGREIVGIYAVTTVIMFCVRVLVKNLYELTYTSKRTHKTLIYGSGGGGVGLAKNIRTEKPQRFQLKGFIAHDATAGKHQLMGVDVYLTLDEVRGAVHKHGIDAVLVSPLRNRDFRRNTELQDLLIGEGVKIYMVENAKEWNFDDTASPVRLKEVQLEDLLPRDEIKVDMERVAEKLKGRRVLVTGSAGSIGSELVRQIASCGPSAMMLIDQAETPQHDIRLMMAKRWPGVPAETVVTSICRKDRMEEIFSLFRPEYVFHAAAYKHVPMMEDNPSEAVMNNVEGTKILADLSVKYGVAKFVMVSTDKAVNPTNVMGCSKRICEIYVQSLNKKSQSTQFVTTRFGNVLGSNGSVIPLFREQIRNGGPVTVTHPDIVRFFMLIPEACQLVLEAGTNGNGGEIFVFDMGQPVKIADLAHRMIRLAGASGVEVSYTGLRAGEKLYEEVLNEKENTKPSFHEKIRIAQVREYDFEQVTWWVDKLIDTSRQFDNMETVRMMKRIVPEYKSNNSQYDVLDKK